MPLRIIPRSGACPGVLERATPRVVFEREPIRLFAPDVKPPRYPVSAFAARLQADLLRRPVK